MRGAVAITAFAALYANSAKAFEPTIEPLIVCNPGVDAEGLYEYTYSNVGDEFVYYESSEYPSGVDVHILEYCPSHRQLVLRLPSDKGGKTQTEGDKLLKDMISGPAPITQKQMAKRLRDAGADVLLRTVDYVSCACFAY